MDVVQTNGCLRIITAATDRRSVAMHGSHLPIVKNRERDAVLELSPKAYPTVKVYTDGMTKIEIDGKPIRGIQRISYDASVWELPQFSLDMVGVPDLEIDNASIILNCDPIKLADAVKILREAIKHDNDMYDAWVASVRNWLENTHEVTASGLARAFVDWLASDDIPTKREEAVGTVADGQDSKPTDREAVTDGQSAKPADTVSSLSDGCEYLDDQWAYALRHDRS